MEKRWTLLPDVPEDVRAGYGDLDPFLVRLLVNRGCASSEAARTFLSKTFDEHIHDPFLFRDMRKAVDRIIRALERNERILLYGDYDVDGVSALSILFLVLKALAASSVSVKIPDRFTEGYGLNERAVRQAAKNGMTLLILCDCGTSNAVEIALAHSLGIETIIVDHHQAPPELPQALAMLNPAFENETYPEKKLCSGGIAWKLATALLTATDYGHSRLEKPLPVGWEKWLLDLAALATVADLMPLVGENRAIVRHGLTVMKKTRHVGLQELSRVMNAPLSSVTTSTIGFQIAPRLNAAGRLEHAGDAFELLTTGDRDQAAFLARKLNAANSQRQRMTENAYREALEQVSAEQPPLLVVATGEGWSSGIIGLVAGRLKEAFHRPAIAIGGENGKLVGSGRSIAGLNITKALVEAGEHLEKFGGHPMACGFTVASKQALPLFVDAMRSIVARELDGADLRPELRIDAELSFHRLDWDLLSILSALEPYGVGVPAPVFVTRNARLLDVRRVGREGKHLRLRVAHGDDRIVPAIGFSLGGWADRLRPGDTIDCVYRVSLNEWNGQREIQLELADIQPQA